MRILRALALVCVAGWLGIMAFFSLGAVPLVLRAIDRASAGQAVVAVLPSYSTWGVVLCAIALVASVLQAASGAEGRLRPLVGAALCGVTLGLLVWSSTVVTPHAVAAWRARDDKAFAQSHRALVRLNVTTMAAGAAFLLIEVLSLPSRRRGR